MCGVLYYFVPSGPCDDDTYLLDRDLFPKDVRDKCENPRQRMAPPFMMNTKTSKGETNP